jgi:ribonuclease BN (tRNA processing enzyme)
VSLTVTVLGCSGTYAAAGNACSGYLVRGGGVSVLLDAGPGTLANLQRHLALEKLDAVVVTHSHPDHWLEIPVMRNALRYVLDRRDLPFFTTVETMGLAEQLGHGLLVPTFVPHVITDGSEFSVGPLRFRTSRTDHPPETLAMRIDLGDDTLAYTADTGPEWSVGEFGPGIDLAISEATFLEADLTGIGERVHLTAAEAGSAAAAAGVRRLLVTHVLPTGSTDKAVAEASDAYGAPVEPAEVNRTYTV